METADICRLTAEGIRELLTSRMLKKPDAIDSDRRSLARWPFPGTVELWTPDEHGVEQHTLATSLNLSLGGVGIRCDEPLALNLELAIAIHEPEVSFHGRAVVRHCTEIEEDYLVGLQFVFDGE